MKTHRAFVLAIALACGACGSLEAHHFAIGAAHPPAASRPAVFFEGELPKQPMEELALVEALGTGNRGDLQTVVEAIVNQAAGFGASAVVRVKVECGLGQCHAYGVAVRFLKP